MWDWDFYARPEELPAVRAALEHCDSRTDRVGTTHFLDGKGLRVSVMAWCDVADALLAAPDTSSGEALGLDVAVIGPCAQLALKLGYVRASVAHADKNWRDVRHWLASLPPGSWSSDHDLIFRRMWTRAEDLFGLAPSDPSTSREQALLLAFTQGHAHV